MNLRVLIYMNPLTVDKVSKKFLWWKDSGFLYTKQLIASLPKGYHYTILTPKGFDTSFFGEGNITCVEYDYSTSIHQNRYHFNRNIIAKALPYGVDIDVVLNMQPEVAANLRVFFENQRREKPIIVNYFHWIDCKESRNGGEKFIYRQLEGANAADLNLFHSDQAMTLFNNSLVEEQMLHLLKETTVCDEFHPLPTTYGMKPILTPDKYILFNHRLNNTTGWREVLEIYKKLDTDTILWFTDESNLKVKKELEDTPGVIVASVPFESYGYVLANAHFTVCNLQEYATWNMAVLDSIHHGTQVISNNTPLMKQLGAHYTNELELSIKERLDGDKLVVRCENHTDFDLVDYLEETIDGRVSGKNPKKCDEVYNYINDVGTVEKREWVNRFWSFHANSNFQVIRWKLLCDGIEDDTTKTLTTYQW